MAKRNSFDDRGDGRSNKRRKSSEHRGFDRGSSNNNNRNDNDGCGVFVGNLKYETRWQALKDHMRQAGNVNSANILEAPNGRSKGCAVVVYQHFKEAQRAIRELNESELEGRTIYVQPDTGGAREPNGDNRSSRGNNFNNNSNNSQYGVYVGNLPYECSQQALENLFRSCGSIVNVSVMEDPRTGRKKGFGVVAFSNQRAMDNAIRKFDGRDFQGRTLTVRPDKKAGESSSNDNGNHRSSGGGGGNEFKVFIGNLDYDCSWQDLKDLVKKQCGHVEHVDIPTKGWGIATFDRHRDGAAAISKLDKVVFQKRALEVRWDRGSSSGKPEAGRERSAKPAPKKPKKPKNEDNDAMKGGEEDFANRMDMALSAGR